MLVIVYVILWNIDRPDTVLTWRLIKPQWIKQGYLQIITTVLMIIVIILIFPRPEVPATSMIGFAVVMPSSTSTLLVGVVSVEV